MREISVPGRRSEERVERERSVCAPARRESVAGFRPRGTLGLPLRLLLNLLLAQLLGAGLSPSAFAQAIGGAKTTEVLDPSARMQSGDHASEYWTLYVELESGHRITQRFLITNAGPGDHSAVAVGHLLEKGRPPFRYVNGRRKGAWILSNDRLFFDIGASHLDLHRPKGALKITKDDIDILLDFDFKASVASGRVPASQLPNRYFVEVLAAGVPTQGTLRAPWMTAPLAVKGRTWLIHTWTPDDEAALINRRVDAFGRSGGTVFYGLQVTKGSKFSGAWQLLSRPVPGKLDSRINFPGRWQEGSTLLSGKPGTGFPVPDRFQITGERGAGDIRLSREWLRFDPLEVIPQPFRWFIRRSTQPQEVWADTRIAVSIRPALAKPSLPPANAKSPSGTQPSAKTLVANTTRENEDETAVSNVMGVASITFMNPVDRP